MIGYMSINNENLKFEIILVVRGQFTIIEKATGDSLTEVLAKSLFVVKNVQEKLSQKEFEARIESTNDNDIPF